MEEKPGVLVVAAIASLGAGAVHATAAGVHAETLAAIAFSLTAVAQLGWGSWALARPVRRLSLVGVAVNATAVGAWVLAKTIGVPFVDGLEVSERIQYADATAAALALIAVAGTLATLIGRRAPVRPAYAIVAAVAATALVIPAMVTPSHHEHASHRPVPYTATLPVDLSGVPGVPAQEVAKAEAIVTAALQKLPQFADLATVFALGYRTIGDAHTGYEHFVKWDLIADGRVLDPDYPESLVFRVDEKTRKKTLSGAMFIANPGDTLDSVSHLRNALMQWHVHTDLCFTGEPSAWRVAQVTKPGQRCRPSTRRLRQMEPPMIHVWTVPHPCGPFAALEGDSAGQIRTGEERLCDHAHGTS